MELGAPYMGPFCEEVYNALDIVLCEGILLKRCSEILSIKEAALETYYHLVKSVFAFDISIGGNKNEHETDFARAAYRKGRL